MARFWWRDGAYVPLTHDEWGRTDSEDLAATLELTHGALCKDKKEPAITLNLGMMDHEPARPSDDYGWMWGIDLGRPWEEQA